MPATVKFDTDLHFEHEQWKRELLFWEDEMKSFQNRLDEIHSRWTDQNILAELEQFQNRFTIHANRIHDYKHAIKLHDLNLAKQIEMNNNAIDRVEYTDHLELREKMEAQRTIYSDLKNAFFRFLSKYM